MTTWGSRWILGMGLMVLASATYGCDRKPQTCSESVANEPPVDPQLMAFLSRARAAHHAADLQEDNVEKSLLPLLELISGPTPGAPKTPPAEVREVLADSYARIADLESALGRFESAYQRIDQGLGYVPEVSYFRGHLLETEGLVAERQASGLTKRGQLPEADAARARALKAFETAMEVQAAVIKNTPVARPRNHTQAPPAATTTNELRSLPPHP